MGQLNFWDLNYFFFILGFLFVPRITIMLIFSSYVTGGFGLNVLFVGLTIWWKFPALGLGFWSKFGFMFLFNLAPRILLAVIGYQYLSPVNHVAMIIFGIIGGIIDIVVKNLLQMLRE